MYKSLTFFFLKIQKVDVSSKIFKSLIFLSCKQKAVVEGNNS